MITGPLSRWSIDSLCAESGFNTDKAVIDLRGTTFIEPFALIQLGMVLRHATAHGVRGSLLLPEEPRVRNFVTRQNFWQRFHLRLDPSKHSDLLRKISSDTSFNDIIDIERGVGVEDMVTDFVGHVLEGRTNREAVMEIASELVSNFERHSEGSLGACMLQLFPNVDRVEFVIGDWGIGFRKSLLKLEQNRPAVERRTDPQVIMYAIQEGVTGSTFGGGTGLSEVVQRVQELGGRLTIASGRGRLEISMNRARGIGLQFDFPGVQVSATVPSKASP